MTETILVCETGTGTEYVAPDATVTVKISGEHTDGRYELFEVDAPRGPTAPPHREAWSKAYYVLRGRILVHIDDHGYDLGPGSAITIPAGTTNTFSVLTPIATFLTISAGHAMGLFFAELDRSEPADDEALRQIADRHGVTIVAGG